MADDAGDGAELALEDDGDFKLKDDILAELEDAMAESMGKNLGKKPAAVSVEVIASKGKKKDDEDEDEVY